MIYLAGTDFSHLTTDELINGIKALKLPDYIRSKTYGIDVRESLAQMTEMTIQLGVNMGLSPDDALKWARKLQESVSQSEFDSWVATLLDGGPSIFMNTLTELQTTYPNGASGVALVRETDPAKIYVWNGTAWEDFGDYQGIEIKDGTVTESKLATDSVTSEKVSFVERAESKKDVYETIKVSDYQNEANDGKILNSLGKPMQSAATVDFTYTDPIPVIGGADYAATYRKLTVYDSENEVIEHWDNSGYTDVLESKKIHRLPKNATNIRVTLGKARVTRDTIERITPTNGVDLIKFKNAKISAQDTDFARYGDPVKRDYYEQITVSKYSNTNNNGKLLGDKGVPLSSEFTADLTFTNIIPVSANTTYSLQFRSLVVFNEDGSVIDFVSNSGYHPSLYTKTEYTTPSNATHMVVNLNTERAKTDTIERITPLGNENTVIIDNLKVSPNHTDFATVPDEDGRVYEYIKVAEYKNSENDGKVLSSEGVAQESIYTTDLTYTEKIPVIAGGLYYVDSRSFVVFDKDELPIIRFDNPGYSHANTLKKEYRLPENAAYVVINLAIEKVDTDTMDRLTPNVDERPIEIKNLKVPKVALKGKSILVLGDSINANYANNISEFIQKSTGANVLNGALGGARLSTKTGNSENIPTGAEVVKSLISGDFQPLENHINENRTGALLESQLKTLETLKSVDLNELDFVILAFGTNDRLESVPIGSDTDDETKFKGALKLSIERLQSANPQLKVMLASQPYSYRHDGAGAYYDENTPNLAGHVISDYVKAMEDIADKYHVHFVDNYTNAGINEFNKSFYFNTIDGIHGKQESFIPLLAENYINKLSQI